METKKVAVTPVYQKLDAAYRCGRYNVFVLEGGSRSSKTYSIIQFWVRYALEHQDRERRVIVSRLKATWITATVLKDFMDVLKDYGLYNPKQHNKSVGAGVYKLFTTEFWFLGLDDEQRIHGMKSDAFWINEAVEASFDDYAQLMQRCSGFAILDYNPSYDEHWIYDKICKRERTRYMHSTMLDNPLIPDNAKEQILSYEPTPYNIEHGTADKRKWQIYGLGKRASLEGLIYEKWGYCKEIPQNIKKRGYGMDFGFSLDPTAIVDCAYDNRTNTLYLDEVCYRTHMESADIIRFYKAIQKMKIMSESADPRLISEIRNSGALIYAVSKGAGSIEASISVIQGYRILVTERSVNLIKELKNYTWEFDEKTKRFINQPAKGQADHCFTGDTFISTANGDKRIDEISAGDYVFTSKGLNKVSKVFDNGIREILHIRLFFSNFTIEIRATHDHKIKTKKGWKPIKELKKGDVLYTFKYSTGKNTSCTLVKDTFPGDAEDCTEKCGSFIMGIFQKGITSITRMKIHGIMKSRTLNWSKALNTCGFMRKNIRKTPDILIGSKQTLTMQERLQTNGTNQRKEGNGIAEWLKNMLRTFNRRNTSVSGAGRSLNQNHTAQTSSVQTNANLHTDFIQGLTMKQGYARNAGENLSSTNITRMSIAAGNARLFTIEEICLTGVEMRKGSSQRVYDLEIENEHEYFANGILVHNCLDAFRYWVMGEIMGRIIVTKNYSKEDLGL